MSFSEFELQKLLEKLQEEKTESEFYDAKEELHLKTEGDKARFIRHVVALANNGQSSYLIIGVEDKSWVVKGIPEGSDLLNADESQKRMNQVLNGRIDPSLSVRFRVYKLADGDVGVVTVLGKERPYIIAIQDATYGGPRTRAAPEYIQRGVIYVRQGANSVVANRQSRIMNLIDRQFNLVDAFADIFLVGVVIGGINGFFVSYYKGDATPAVGGFWGAVVASLISIAFREKINNPFYILGFDVLEFKFFKSVFPLFFGGLSGYLFGSSLFEIYEKLPSLKVILSSVLLSGLMGGFFVVFFMIFIVVVYILSLKFFIYIYNRYKITLKNSSYCKKKNP